MSLVPRTKPSAASHIRTGAPVPMPPWTRYRLDAAAWVELGDRLLDDGMPLVTLWCDGEAVHALFLEGAGLPLVASVAVEMLRYRSLSPARPAALACERIVRDLWGVEAVGIGELRPWLDHGLWGLTAPLSQRPGRAPWPPEPPEFSQIAAEAAAGAFQLGIGPVQSLISGPVHLRLTLDGERIVRLQLLLGYAHRGVAALMRGRLPMEAAALAGRLDAQSCVAQQAAFARAVEAARAWRITARAEALRALMTELELVAMDLHHLARLLRDVGSDRLAVLPGAMRENVLVACESVFGHRLMMDTIVPGGLARAPSEAGLVALLPELDRLQASLPSLRCSVERTAGHRLAGRAGVRTSVAGASLGGDALDRGGARLDRLARALQAARSWLLADPAGAVFAEAPAAQDLFEAASEGLGASVSLHGTVWHWVRLEGGRIVAMHMHDPVLPLWQLLEQAAIGMTPDELGLLCTSLGLSVSGADQ